MVNKRPFIREQYAESEENTIFIYFAVNDTVEA